MGTRDTLFDGRVVLEQPARGEGYRANVDALLLASFARSRGRAKVAFDLGSGAGAVSLALLHHDACNRAVLVEIDADAAALARSNLEANQWADRADVVAGDVIHVALEHRGRADLVVCNPPYFAPGRGRLPKDPARARARSGELGSFIAAARALLGRRGRACFVYPAGESITLLTRLREAGLEPKRLRPVRATSSDPARVILVEAMAAKAGGLVMEPDFVEREGGGYTDEVARIIAGR